MNRLTAAWDRLPRDGRDTLFQLAVVGWTLLPHADHLPAWCVALAVAMLGWRGALAMRGGPLPSRWAVGAVLAGAIGMTLWTQGTLLGKEPGVTMLVVLMTLKTLELRARRDALVVFFLGFFLVLTNFLYSQSLAVAVSMLLSVWGLLTALVLAHMPVGRPALAQAGGLAARAALLGAPLMLLLFLLFPRVGPLWGPPADAAGRTGLSGTMRMGAVAEIANDDSIAFRVRFAGTLPTAAAMYFRGPVLGRFDGVDWSRLTPTVAAAERLRPQLRLHGTPVRYEMTLEPSRLPLLPLLEATPDQPDAAPAIDGWPAVMGADLQWRLDRALDERVRFSASAWPDFRHGPTERQPALVDWLALPAGYNPRTLQWVLNLRAEPALARAGARTLAERLLRHIREGGYEYTLQPGTYGRDAIDEFWLDRRSGFCEHFAASFVVIMRALGVPARVVTGYQGTDPLPVDGYWIVRQSNAHAWAEYWVEGEGWVRADPTGAVAPDRIRRPGQALSRTGLVASAFRGVSPELMESIRALWGGVNNRWNQWVLGYSRKDQFDLLRSLGVPTPSWEALADLLIGLLAGAAVAGAGWAAWDRRRQDPWQRLQQRIQHQLGRLGVNVAPHDPPRRRASATRAALGERGEVLARALEALDAQRYGQPGPPRPQPGWWRHFARAAQRARATSAP